MPARARTRRATPAPELGSGAGGLTDGLAAGGDRSEIGRRAQIVEIQRSRLLAAAVKAVDELGYGRVTVADITSRARVSRRTFYEMFANREECLAAVLENVVGLVGGEIARAGLGGLAWRERVRGGLLATLSFFDREPALARVCIVGALGGGPRVLERREEILAGLAAVVDEGRGEAARGRGCTQLTAEGSVGAAFAIVHSRLLRGEREPLTGLLGELMGMIVLPYRGAAAARREVARLVPVGPVGAAGGGGAVGDPLQGVSMRLTYRTARVLEGVAECPGGSNREVAERAGVQDPGQVSKLLARLERLGLLVNTGEGHAKGEPNAWSLTPKGRLVAQGIHIHASGESEAA
jgi:AcrR family transcriptional regulator